jgi:hypothetical protein
MRAGTLMQQTLYDFRIRDCLPGTQVMQTAKAQQFRMKLLRAYRRAVTRQTG